MPLRHDDGLADFLLRQFVGSEHRERFFFDIKARAFRTNSFVKEWRTDVALVDEIARFIV